MQRKEVSRSMRIVIFIGCLRICAHEARKLVVSAHFSILLSCYTSFALLFFFRLAVMLPIAEPILVMNFQLKLNPCNRTSSSNKSPTVCCVNAVERRTSVPLMHSSLLFFTSQERSRRANKALAIRNAICVAMYSFGASWL